MTEEKMISRVKSVSLNNFRGFKEGETSNSEEYKFYIDTDADIVLVVGPNGCGKTSFLEAVTLLLTQWHGYNEDSDIVSASASDCKLKMVYNVYCKKSRSPEGREFVRTGILSKGSNISFEDESNFSWSTIGSNDAEGSDGRELNARLCAFFQSRLKMIFDQAAKGKTLGDVVEPIPESIRRIWVELDKVHNHIKTNIEAGKLNQDRLDSTYNSNELSMKDDFNFFIDKLKSVIERDKNLKKRYGDVLADSIYGSVKEINSFASSFVEATSRVTLLDRGEGLREKFDLAIRKMIQELIAGNYEGQDEGSFRNDLILLGNRLGTFISSWAKVQDVEASKAKSNEKENAIKSLELVYSDINKILSCFESFGVASRDLLNILTDNIRNVMGILSVGDGVCPVSVQKTEEGKNKNGTSNSLCHILTKDQRTVEMLSTGQEVQVAISFLVAQNLSLYKWLNHGILIIDDVTSAYDLSALTREAILWRQIAYCSDGEPFKRQIFISSHHEDMSNHLLDLLIPPAGRSMRLVRFNDWSSETGPSYDVYDVEPSKIDVRVSADSPQDLGAGGLKTVFEGLETVFKALACDLATPAREVPPSEGTR